MVTGITNFKKTCRLTAFNGKIVKAWRVPGTPEHGKYCQLRRYQDKINSKIKKVQAYVASLPGRELTPGFYVDTIGYKWVTVGNCWDGQDGYKVSLQEFFADMPDFWKN